MQCCAIVVNMLSVKKKKLLIPTIKDIFFTAANKQLHMKAAYTGRDRPPEEFRENVSESVSIYSMCSFLLRLNSLTSAPPDPELHMAEPSRLLKEQLMQKERKHITSLTPYDTEPHRCHWIVLFCTVAVNRRDAVPHRWWTSHCRCSHKECSS